MRKKTLALLLALVMVLSMTPAALAAPPEYGCPGDDYGRHHWDEGDPSGPWCEEPEITYYFCSYCDQSYEEITGPALGHDWGEWRVLNSASCFTPGQETRHCRRCGKEEYRAIPAGHIFGNWEEYLPATCIQKGLSQRVCMRCGYTEVRSEGYGTHLWGEWKVVTPATPDAPGLERRVCQYTDEHVEERQIPYGSETGFISPDLAVKLEVEDGSGNMKQVGDLVWSRLIVTNTGADPWEAESLTVSIPYFVSDASYDSSEWTPNIGKVLENGESFSFKIGNRVNPEDIANGAVQRTVSVRVESPVTLDSAISDIETIDIALTYELQSIRLDAVYEDRAYMPGQTCDIQLSVTNTGLVPLTYKNHQSAIPAGENDPLAGLPQTLAVGETWYAPVFTTTVRNYDVEAAEAQIADTFWRVITVTYVYDAATGEQEAFDDYFIVLPMLRDGDPLPAPDPDEEGPKLRLDAVCLTAEPFYFNYAGETEEIQYLLTVANTGEFPCDFSQVEIYTDGSGTVVDVGSHVLQPGESVTIPMPYIFIEFEMDEHGQLSIGFTAIGYTPTQTVLSNQETFTHQTSGDPKPWTPPTESSMKVEKNVLSVPANAGGYVEGETVTYQIAVTNTGDEKVAYVPVWDELYSETENVDVFHALEPNETRAAEFDYTVTKLDVDNGYIYNIARVTWNDPETDTELTAWSDPVVVPTTIEDLHTYGVYVEVTFLEPPKNGSYYELGEQIPVQVYWENQSDDTLYSVNVYEDAAYWSDTASNGIIFSAAEMAPGENGTSMSIVTVDQYCIDVGNVTDVAEISGYDRKGNFYVHVDAAVGQAGLGGYYSLSVVKEEISVPANGSYYVEGETISYKIYLKNVGKAALEDVHLYDTLASSMTHSGFSTTKFLDPGEEKVYPFSYTVTAADAAAGKVVNAAVGTYLVSEGYVPVQSNLVESPTGGSESGLIPPVFVTVGDPDSCVLTLTGMNDSQYQYTLTPCAKHGETAKQAEEAITGGKTDAGRKIAWEKAKKLWLADIDALYEELYEAARSDAKPAVVQDRLAFLSFLENEEARLIRQYPDRLDQAAQALLSLLQEQCAELCYLRHHAPEARPDSVLSGNASVIPGGAFQRCGKVTERKDNGAYAIALQLCGEHAQGNAEINSQKDAASAFQRGIRLWQAMLDSKINSDYRAADAEGKADIAAWRRSVDTLLSTRRDLLTILYPDQPETVNELLCRVMMTRVILRCAAE